MCMYMSLNMITVGDTRVYYQTCDTHTHKASSVEVNTILFLDAMTNRGVA